MEMQRDGKFDAAIPHSIPNDSNEQKAHSLFGVGISASLSESRPVLSLNGVFPGKFLLFDQRSRSERLKRVIQKEPLPHFILQIHYWHHPWFGLC